MVIKLENFFFHFLDLVEIRFVLGSVYMGLQLGQSQTKFHFGQYYL
jgi:hypothetical protein